jgi:hypothetical protein
VRSVDGVAFAAPEHEVVATGGVATEMIGKGGGDGVGEWDGPGLAAL